MVTRLYRIFILLLLLACAVGYSWSAVGYTAKATSIGMTFNRTPAHYQCSETAHADVSLTVTVTGTPHAPYPSWNYKICLGSDTGTVVYQNTTPITFVPGTLSYTQQNIPITVPSTAGVYTYYVVVTSGPYQGATPPEGSDTAYVGSFTVSASAVDHGSVAPLSQTVDCGGTTSNFTASPATGYKVDCWKEVNTVLQTGGITYAMTQVTAPHTITVSFIPIQVTTVTLSPSTVTGGTSSTGTVTLNGTAPVGGFTVTLSSDQTAAGVPATTTVSAGATTGTFTVTTTPVTATTSATITASGGGGQATAVLTINTPIVQSLSLNPSTVTGGNSSTGTVTLTGPALAGGFTVTLSSDQATASVPATTTVAEGATTGTFTVTTTPVTATTTATITASGGGNQATAGLTINTPNVQSVSLNPSTVTGGNSSTGTVTLTGPALAGGFTVTLSSNQAAATVSDTITVAEGATTGTFTVTTTPVANTTTATITASGGGNQATAGLTINSSRVLSVLLTPSTLIGGDSSIGAVTLTGPALAGGFTVTLSSNQTDATVPATITVAAGATTGTFTVTTTPVADITTATITASGGGGQATAVLTVKRGYKVTAAVIPDENEIDHGTVIPVTQYVEDGADALPITATPAGGYAVDTWTGNGTVSEDGVKYTLTNVTADQTVSVAFVPTFIVTGVANGEGSISPAGDQVVKKGHSITFHAYPHLGYGVDSWKVGEDVVQTEGESFTLADVQGPLTVTVTFAQTFTVTAISNGHGLLTPTFQTIIIYRTAHILATPDEGYEPEWAGNGTASEDGRSYTIEHIVKNQTVNTSFTESFTVTATAGPHGTVSPPSIKVKKGDSATFYATPDPGYEVDTWTATKNPVNQTQTGGQSFTVTKVEETTAVSVTFKLLSATTYTVTAQTNPTTGAHGTVWPAIQTVSSGSNPNVHAQPEDGYEVDKTSWTGGNGTASDDGRTYTLSNVTADVTVTVSFIPIVVTFDPDPCYLAKEAPPTSLTVSVTPDNAAEYLEFDTEDGGIATAAGKADNLTVTGVDGGITSVRAKSGNVICGEGSVHVIKVDFPPDPLYLAKGAAKPFTVTVTPAEDADRVSFNTSDAATASVDGMAPDLTVNGLEAGITTVEGMVGTDICGTSAPVHVIKVDFPSDPLYLAKGADATLTVTITPAEDADQVSFDTADNTVALVGGITPDLDVYGADAGITTVQAKVGTDLCDTESAPVHVITVSFPPGTIYTVTDGTQTVTPTVTPEGDGGQVTYTTADPTIATYDGTTVTGVSVGMTTIQASVGTGICDTGMVDVQAQVTATVDGDGGTVAPELQLVDAGGTAIIIASPDPGYAVDSWTDNPNGTASEEGLVKYTLINVTSDQTVSVKFIPTYSVTGSAGEHGSIDPDGEQIVKEGDDIGFTATPEAGYTIDSWTVDDQPAGEDPDVTISQDSATLTLHNVTDDHTVLVTFKSVGGDVTVTILQPSNGATIGGSSVPTQIQVRYQKDISINTVVLKAIEQRIIDPKQAVVVTGYTSDGTPVVDTNDEDYLIGTWSRIVDTRSTYNTDSTPFQLNVEAFPAKLFNSSYDIIAKVTYTKDTIQSITTSPSATCTVNNLNIVSVNSNVNEHYLLFDGTSVQFHLNFSDKEEGHRYRYKLYIWPTKIDPTRISNNYAILTDYFTGIGNQEIDWDGTNWDQSDNVDNGAYTFDLCIIEELPNGNVEDAQWYKSVESGYGSDELHQDSQSYQLDFDAYGNLVEGRLHVLLDDLQPPVIDQSIPSITDGNNTVEFDDPDYDGSKQMRTILMAYNDCGNDTRDHANRPVYSINANTDTYAIIFFQGQDSHQEPDFWMNELKDSNKPYTIKRNNGNIIKLGKGALPITPYFQPGLDAKQIWNYLDSKSPNCGLNFTSNTMRTRNVHISGHSDGEGTLVEVRLPGYITIDEDGLYNTIPVKPYCWAINGYQSDTHYQTGDWVEINELNNLTQIHLMVFCHCFTGAGIAPDILDNRKGIDAVMGSNAWLIDWWLGPWSALGFHNVEKDFMENFYSFCTPEYTLDEACSNAVSLFKNDVERGVYGSMGWIKARMPKTSTNYLGWDTMEVRGQKASHFVEPD